MLFLFILNVPLDFQFAKTFFLNMNGCVFDYFIQDFLSSNWRFLFLK